MGHVGAHCTWTYIDDELRVYPDPVPGDEGDVGGPRIRHRLPYLGRPVRVGTTVEDTRRGVGRRRQRIQHRFHRRPGVEAPPRHAPAELLERLAHAARRDRSVEFRLFDHQEVANVQVVEQEGGRGLPLDVVGRGGSHEVDPVGSRRPKIERPVAGLGQARVRGGRAALQQASCVGDWYLLPGDHGVNGADDGDDARIGDKRIDVGSSPVDVDGVGVRVWCSVVTGVNLQVDGEVAGGVRLVDGELDRVGDRTADLISDRPRQGQVHADRPGTRRQRWGGPKHNAGDANGKGDGRKAGDPQQDPASSGTASASRAHAGLPGIRAFGDGCNGVDRDRLAQTLDALAAQGLERDRGDRLGQGAHRVADQDLPGSGQGTQARCDVDRRADEATVRLDRLPGVDADSHFDRGIGPLGRCGDRTLDDRESAGDGRAGRPEDDVEAVALGLDLGPPKLATASRTRERTEAAAARPLPFGERGSVGGGGEEGGGVGAELIKK